MKENPQEIKKDNKIGLFKKIKYSIFKIEKYPELSSLGLKKALRYIFILLANNAKQWRI